MGRKRNITLKEKQVTDLWLYNFGNYTKVKPRSENYIEKEIKDILAR